MVFSKEQEDIFDYAQHGILNMIVQAVAGAGKTTTLVECANRIDEKHKILMLAHNKSTRDTLKSKVGDKPNIMIYTIHGLGWRMFVENFGFEPEINEFKYVDYINKNIENFGSEEYKSLDKFSKLIYKSNLFDIINKSRQNLKQSEKEIKKMAVKKYGMSLISDEAKTATEILKWGTENTKIVDYQDLLSFPSEFGYFTKRYLSDIIMLDEAQDASIAQQDIISRCFKRNTRLFAYGDRDQTINSWCGSDSDSFEHLKDSNTFRRDSKEFPLTTNYRCGKRIIEYAKQYTNNDIKPSDNANDGEIIFNSFLSDVKEGDMILCRNISPLMSVYRREISLGNKVYFRGEELGSNLKKSVDCSYGDNVLDIIKSIKRRLIKTWDTFTAESGLDERETMTNPVILSLLDTIKTLECLPKTVEKRSDLYKFIEDVFSDEGKEGIQLSTIHRAKGLESDNVYIICRSLIPSRLSTLDWQIEEERHLQYVMCTRPKNKLCFISETDVSANNIFSDSNSLYEELINIKNEIQ